MQSKFSIGGHALHPALVAVPIGLFLWAFAADILYLATDKDKMWYDISLYTSIAAVGTALVAALPGFGDYFTLALGSRASTMATFHMLLNLAVVGLYGAASFMQLDNGALRGTDLTVVVGLHAVGTLFLSVSGYLGGEMAHRHHLSVVPKEETAREREEARHREHVGV